MLNSYAGMFICGVIICLIMYAINDFYIKPMLFKMHERRVAEAKKREYNSFNNKLNRYFDWVEMINNCNDVKQLWTWEVRSYKDYPDDIDIWEIGIEGRKALWQLCHKRSEYLKRTAYEQSVQREINRKTWLIEG